MFETAELDQSVPDDAFERRSHELREGLLRAQWELASTDVPVLVVLAGVDGAGKGDSANLLNHWMDARGIETHAYDDPTETELERPRLWRFWRDLPPRGRMGVFLSAWYHEPFLDHVHGRIDEDAYERRLDEIVAMERTLVDDGALVLKLWLHLGRAQQKARFQRLEADPLWSWRVTETDWRHWRMYDRFVASAERLLLRTSTGDAPWKIVEGTDANFRTLEVAGWVLRGLEGAVARSRTKGGGEEEALEAGAGKAGVEEVGAPRTILSSLDMDRKVGRKAYRKELPRLQGRFHELYRGAHTRGRSTVVVFEGWDAAGKGGAIRRLLPAMDARHYDIHPVAAPTDEEKARHWLWRFWRRLPRAGEVAIFDRSWYGRVLVERVEGFARESEWRRAYAEINDFEGRLVEHGTTVVKFWLHVTPEEQEKRFRAREDTPWKRYKLTEEDWRNRERWAAYEAAVDEMVERTSTVEARWTLVPANDKRYARLFVLETLCDALEAGAAREAGGG